MGYYPGPSESNRLEDLERRMRRMEEFAIAHQQWEAELFAYWEDNPLPRSMMAKAEEVQRLRERVMKDA